MVGSKLKFLENKILPETVNNSYNGHWAGKLILIGMIILAVFRSLVHLLREGNGNVQFSNIFELTTGYVNAKMVEHSQSPVYLLIYFRLKLPILLLYCFICGDCRKQSMLSFKSLCCINITV
jgi:hypothetical protein